MSVKSIEYTVRMTIDQFSAFAALEEWPKERYSVATDLSDLGCFDVDGQWFLSVSGVDCAKAAPLRQPTQYGVALCRTHSTKGCVIADVTLRSVEGIMKWFFGVRGISDGNYCLSRCCNDALMWFIIWSIDRLMDGLINWLAVCYIDCSVDWLIDGLYIEWFYERSIDWLIDWLILFIADRWIAFD